MADKKISQLTAKGSKIASTDRVPIAQDNGGGTFATKYVTGAEINEVKLDTTPQLGGDLDVNGFKLSSANDQDVIINPNGTGIAKIESNLHLRDTAGGTAKQINLYEGFSNGSNYIGIKAPDSLSTDTTYTLPTADGTSGQVLSTNGTGTLSWATAGGGITVGTTAVTSGTDGRVFFQAGGVVQQSANLFWDNTNGRLGIGTITPNSPLNITSSNSASGGIGRIINVVSTLNATANSDNLVAVDITPTFSTGAFTGVNTIGLRVSAGTVSFQGGTLTSAGVLTVNNSVTAGTRVTIGAGLTSATNGAIYTTSSGTRSLEIVSDGTAGRGMIVFTGTGNIGIGTTTDASFRLDVNGTARVQGNVAIGGTSFGSSSDKVFAQYSGIAPGSSPADAFQMYSADVVAGNAAPHIRTENGNIVKIYQETTAVAAATLVSNAGTNITDTDTFDGYTLKQIVKALRNLGILA